MPSLVNWAGLPILSDRQPALAWEVELGQGGHGRMFPFGELGQV
jgi:hypothetical protein